MDRILTQLHRIKRNVKLSATQDRINICFKWIIFSTIRTMHFKLLLSNCSNNRNSNHNKMKKRFSKISFKEHQSVSGKRLPCHPRQNWWTETTKAIKDIMKIMQSINHSLSLPLLILWLKLKIVSLQRMKMNRITFFLTSLFISEKFQIKRLCFHKRRKDHPASMNQLLFIKIHHSLKIFWASKMDLEINTTILPSTIVKKCFHILLDHQQASLRY